MSMNYKELIAQAVKNGVNGEKVMHQSIDDINELLCTVKEADEEAYHHFMRKTYAALYSNHYATEDFAAWDIGKMHSTQADGKKLTGAYWSIEEAAEAFKAMNLPSSATKYDMWVAANAAKHDFGKHFPDDKVLDIAYLFYFADEDYPQHDKVFRYISMLSAPSTH